MERPWMGSCLSDGRSHPVRFPQQLWGVWATEVVALTQRDSQLADDLELSRGLDPDRDDARSDLTCERDEGRGHRALRPLRLDLPRQADVELDEIRVELQDVAEARVPCTHVVDRQACPAATERRVAVRNFG